MILLNFEACTWLMIPSLVLGKYLNYKLQQNTITIYWNNANCYARDGRKVQLGFVKCKGGSSGACLATACAGDG